MRPNGSAELLLMSRVLLRAQCFWPEYANFLRCSYVKRAQLSTHLYVYAIMYVCVGLNFSIIKYPVWAMSEPVSVSASRSYCA